MAANRSLLVGMIVSTGLSLSACSQERESDAFSNDPLAGNSTAKGDQFGKGFGKAFRADPHSEPINVSREDVIPVSNTAEPVEFD